MAKETEQSLRRKGHVRRARWSPQSWLFLVAPQAAAARLLPTRYIDVSPRVKILRSTCLYHFCPGDIDSTAYRARRAEIIPNDGASAGPAFMHEVLDLRMCIWNLLGRWFIWWRLLDFFRFRESRFTHCHCESENFVNYHPLYNFGSIYRENKYLEEVREASMMDCSA